MVVVVVWVTWWLAWCIGGVIGPSIGTCGTVDSLVDVDVPTSLDSKFLPLSTTIPDGSTVVIPIRYVFLLAPGMAFWEEHIRLQHLRLNADFNNTGLQFSIREVAIVRDATFYGQCGNAQIRATMVKRFVHSGDEIVNVLYCDLDVGGRATFPWDVRGKPHIQVSLDTLYGRVPHSPYNLGRTLVHEMGHFLGLRHPFVSGKPRCDDGDFITDTPIQAGATLGCQVGRDSCPRHPGADPVHNYMSYSTDYCMLEFTPGQIRVLQRIGKNRPSMFKLYLVQRRVVPLEPPPLPPHLNPLLVSPPRVVPCPTNDTCSGHGSCIHVHGHVRCICSGSGPNGFYTGPRCDRCSPFRYGPTCQKRIALQVSPSLMSVTVAPATVRVGRDLQISTLSPSAPRRPTWGTTPTLPQDTACVGLGCPMLAVWTTAEVAPTTTSNINVVTGPKLLEISIDLVGAGMLTSGDAFPSSHQPDVLWRVSGEWRSTRLSCTPESTVELAEHGEALTFTWCGGLQSIVEAETPVTFIVVGTETQDDVTKPLWQQAWFIAAGSGAIVVLLACCTIVWFCRPKDRDAERLESWGWLVPVKPNPCPVIRLSGSPFKLGRAPTNDFTFEMEQAAIAPTHCVLHCNPKTLTATIVDTSHTTLMVDKLPVEKDVQVVLLSGSIISIPLAGGGALSFAFQIGSTPPIAPWAHLVLLDEGSDDQQCIPITADPFVCGRAPSCHYVFPALMVHISSRHFLLQSAGDKAVCFDLSTNGLQINGEDVGTGREVTIQDGCEIGVPKGSGQWAIFTFHLQSHGLQAAWGVLEALPPSALPSIPLTTTPFLIGSDSLSDCQLPPDLVEDSLLFVERSYGDDLKCNITVLNPEQTVLVGKRVAAPDVPVTVVCSDVITIVMKDNVTPALYRLVGASCGPTDDSDQPYQPWASFTCLRRRSPFQSGSGQVDLSVLPWCMGTSTQCDAVLVRGSPQELRVHMEDRELMVTHVGPGCLEVDGERVSRDVPVALRSGAELVLQLGRRQVPSSTVEPCIPPSPTSLSRVTSSGRGSTNRLSSTDWEQQPTSPRGGSVLLEVQLRFALCMQPALIPWAVSAVPAHGDVLDAPCGGRVQLTSGEVLVPSAPITAARTPIVLHKFPTSIPNTTVERGAHSPSASECGSPPHSPVSHATSVLIIPEGSTSPTTSLRRDGTPNNNIDKNRGTLEGPYFTIEEDLRQRCVLCPVVQHSAWWGTINVVVQGQVVPPGTSIVLRHGDRVEVRMTSVVSRGASNTGETRARSHTAARRSLYNTLRRGNEPSALPRDTIRIVGYNFKERLRARDIGAWGWAQLTPIHPNPLPQLEVQADPYTFGRNADPLVMATGYVVAMKQFVLERSNNGVTLTDHAGNTLCNQQVVPEAGVFVVSGDVIGLVVDDTLWEYRYRLCDPVVRTVSDISDLTRVFSSSVSSDKTDDKVNTSVGTTGWRNLLPTTNDTSDVDAVRAQSSATISPLGKVTRRRGETMLPRAESTPAAAFQPEGAAARKARMGATLQHSDVTGMFKAKSVVQQRSRLQRAGTRRLPPSMTRSLARDPNMMYTMACDTTHLTSPRSTMNRGHNDITSLTLGSSSVNHQCVTEQRVVPQHSAERQRSALMGQALPVRVPPIIVPPVDEWDDWDTTLINVKDPLQSPLPTSDSE